MMFPQLALVVLSTTTLVLFSSVVTATNIRGGSSNAVVEEVRNQFTCTITAFDQGTCKSTKDDDGNDCVWCSLSSYGFCLSDDMAKQIEDQVPQVQCDDDDVDSGVDSAIIDFGSIDNFWDCLQKSTDKDMCKACDECTYCTTKVVAAAGGGGVCLANDAIGMIPDDFKTILDCDDDDDDEEDIVAVKEVIDESALEFYGSIVLSKTVGDNPYKCTTTAFDEDTCKATKDDDGVDCVWCSFMGYGACLNDEVAKQVEAEVPEIMCSDVSSDEVLDVLADEKEETTAATAALAANAASNALTADATSSFDTSCLFAGGTGNDAQDACAKTMDSTNNACVWCSATGTDYGLCLSSDEASMVSQFLQCDNNNNDQLLLSTE